MDHSIEICNLTKRFQREPSLAELVFKPFRKREYVTAVENISLQVKKGEVFGLLGPNGAGKTTLIKLLCNLIIPTSGSARVGGYDIVEEGQHVRGSIGLVTSDERSFFWRLSGRRNLEFFGSLYNLPHRTVERRVAGLLRQFSLEGKADIPFRTYSAGMKKKMAIVRGLLNDPEILFMDEPTNSLDPIAAQQLKAFVRDEIASGMGKTVFWATHRLEEVEGLCDGVALMKDARIAFTGSVREFKGLLIGEAMYDLHVAGLNGKIEGIMRELNFKNFHIVSETRDETSVEWNEHGNETLGEQLLARVLLAKGRVINYRLKESSLEDVFMHLVRRR